MLQFQDVVKIADIDDIMAEMKLANEDEVTFMFLFKGQTRAEVSQGTGPPDLSDGKARTRCSNCQRPKDLRTATAAGGASLGLRGEI